MKCPNCGVENLDGIRFCNYCGREFPKTAPAGSEQKTAKCMRCGFSNPEGAIFCNQCGNDMRMAVSPPMVAPQPNTKACVSCGKMIPADANLCPYCRYNYRAQPTPVQPPAPPQFYPPMQASYPAAPPQPVYQAPPAPMKPCISCGRPMPVDANLCPYCQYNYRPPQKLKVNPTSAPPAPQMYQPAPPASYPQYQSQFAPPPQAADSKPCASCGRIIPVDANMCPYCMYKYRR